MQLTCRTYKRMVCMGFCAVPVLAACFFMLIVLRIKGLSFGLRSLNLLHIFAHQLHSGGYAPSLGYGSAWSVGRVAIVDFA